jgi:universal stress protein A
MYMELRRILCGVDFSDDSICAFKAAVDLARFFKADLCLLHVIEPNLGPANLMPVQSVDEQVMSIEHRAMRALEVLISRWGAGLDENQVTTQITTGHPGTELVKYSREQAIDLTVIGAKGVKFFEEAVIGGTTERVVKQAGCSVLVIRS